MEEPYVDECRQIAIIIKEELEANKEEILKNLELPYDGFINDLLYSLNEIESGKYEDEIDDYKYLYTVESALPFIQMYMTKEMAIKIYPIIEEFAKSHMGHPMSLNKYQYDSILNLILFSLSIYKTGEYDKLLKLKQENKKLSQKRNEMFDKANAGMTLLSEYLMSIWD